MMQHPHLTNLADDTMVCRCEEVTALNIRESMREGSLTLNDVKRRTRAGMGLCQGVFCMRTIAEMLHTEGGEPREAIVPMTARPPARIIPLHVLADLEK